MAESLQYRNAAPERVTQSFVGTLSECWHRPSLTALEVLWRWIWGIPTLWLLWRQATRILLSVQLDYNALKQMTLLDPMKTSATLAQATFILLPPVLQAAKWIVPLLAMTWLIVSSIGRTLVLRRADSKLLAKPLILIALQVIRLVALGCSFCIWFFCLQYAAQVAVEGPISHGAEPSLVLYFAIAIISTLGLFTLWAIVSWIFSIAPLLAMLRGTSIVQSLADAFRLGPLRIKLVEINLVMGIVKIALIVLAMVFSACPLPFQSVATQEFLNWWWAGVIVLYLLGSDFFHIARLVAYLQLWRTSEAR